MATAYINDEDVITSSTSDYIPAAYRDKDTDDDADEIEQNGAQPRRRGAGAAYVHVETYDHKAEALAAMAGAWSRKHKTENYDGEKIYYECRRDHAPSVQSRATYSSTPIAIKWQCFKQTSITTTQSL